MDEAHWHFDFHLLWLHLEDSSQDKTSSHLDRIHRSVQIDVEGHPQWPDLSVTSEAYTFMEYALHHQ